MSARTQVPERQVQLHITIAVLIACLVIMLVVMYNRLIRARQLVREGWSGIDVQLKRRHDLIPNLVEIVKGYSSHESTLFEEIAKTRSEATASGDVPGRGNAESTLTKQIKSLFAVAEAYPDLKASTNFAKLQESLSTIEDEIQYARRYYNGTVRDYNIRVETFPSNLIALLFSFKREPFFEIEYATERSAPDVEFA